MKRKHQLGGNTIVTHLLFYLASGSFFLGTNDNLFVCFLVVFFSEVVLFISRQSDRISGFAWFCLVSAFFTREMAVVYLPLIACMTLFIFNSSKFRPKEAGLVIGSVAFWIVLNIPSIAHHGSLSFDNKEMAKQNGITWPQRQYLSQLYATQGIIPELSHVSWEETRSYLEKNGKDSLPSSTFDSLVFDISFTWKEFWKDFLYLIYSGFRQVGLVIFFPFLMFITPTKENQAIRLIGFGQLLQMLVFSAIIISYIEIRWLAPAFILGILGMDLLLKSREGKAQVDFINQIVLTALSIYGIFAYIHLIGNTRTWLETFF
ncbi:hypothetical protein J0A67_03560 [Algoriphagus aestuariicola]|uniref:Glycosyltransferase RgtA/B/C/D-like domain-containing protein n=1 Tax=Algoriphagus aestuariicola TaxID=1852016 RepID=A0ABS3BNL7_9BACT|nr:hypothetical protein [Algoriphagus aestuariicola]MBN7799920.1 hypothetical protein [Algoriphagus aestuariicola]